MAHSAQSAQTLPAGVAEAGQPIEMLDGKVVLYPGDCIETMRSLPENSVDSVVCDPPYHLTSIVKRFGGDMPPRTEATVGKRAYGRHAHGFMGRTWDGGDIAFRVETWAEVLRVLKPGGYLLAFASTRGFGRMSVAIEDAGFIVHPFVAWIFGSGFPKATRIKAEGYDGFRYGGQALKPAIEPIFMGQKPFSEKTGTDNILRWGTGAVNIDGCRVGESGARNNGRQAGTNGIYGEIGATTPVDYGMGRWPANIVHDGSDEVLAAFPERDGATSNSRSGVSGIAAAGLGARPVTPGRDDGGSAARFFYSAKADKNDRLSSRHPTVKPVSLCQWLCRLVTPPGGTILDPFAGSGTTGEAAWREGFSAILCEREEEYQADIQERMRLANAGPIERKARIASRKRAATAGPLFGDNDNTPVGWGAGRATESLLTSSQDTSGGGQR